MAQISCPKILHGLLAAGTDIWLAELSRIVLGGDYVSTIVRFLKADDHYESMIHASCCFSTCCHCLLSSMPWHSRGRFPTL